MARGQRTYSGASAAHPAATYSRCVTFVEVFAELNAWLNHVCPANRLRTVRRTISPSSAIPATLQLPGDAVTDSHKLTGP